MSDPEPVGQQRGHSLVKAITTACALGVGWFVIVLVYAAWVGVHG